MGIVDWSRNKESERDILFLTTTVMRIPAYEYAHTLAQIINPQSILVASHKLYYLCLISLFTGPEMISYCSYMATITYSHACHPPANLIRLEPSRATLHRQDAKTTPRAPRRSLPIKFPVKHGVDCLRLLKLCINMSAWGQN